RPAVRDRVAGTARLHLYRRARCHAHRCRRAGAGLPGRRVVRPVRPGAGADDPGTGAGRVNALRGALIPLLLATPLAAQEAGHGPVVGVGITVPDVGLLLPINVSAHFRLEPYVLFYSARSDFPATSDTEWISRTQLGLGVFSVTRPGETVRVYFGARVGLL